MKVVILGAGAAGLTAAWDLARQGVAVTVIEQCTQPGGLCQTFEKNGFRFDLGGHRFITKNKTLEEEMLQLLGDDLQKRSRKSVVLFEGHEFAYPLKATDILKNLGASRALRALLSYLKSQWAAYQGKLTEETFEGWAKIHFGNDLYQKFFGPYTTKLWGISPAELASDWAGQRISLLNLKETLFHLLHLTSQQPRTYAMEYYYPRKGIGQMFSRMAEDIFRNGGTFFYETQVQKIYSENAQVCAVQVKKNSEMWELEADAFISTIPLADAVRAFSPVPSSLEKHCAALQYRALRCFNLMIDQENFGDTTWRYVADGHRLMTRIQEPKQRSSSSAPPGKTSLMLEIPCFQEEPIWNATEESLLKRALPELKELGFDIEKKLLGYFSTRTTHAYPLFRIGYQMHRKQLLEFLQPFQNFFTCGRQGTFRYLFQDTAQLTGRAVARQLLSGWKDPAELEILDAQSSLQEIQATTA